MPDWLMPVITVAAIIVGPILAVSVTLWHENRKQKLAAKRWLFFTLMAYRKSWPPAPDWLSALNQIDVVFYDVPPVVQAWRTYHDALCVTSDEHLLATNPYTKMLDLLHEMAQHLSYSKIKPGDLDRFYSPKLLGNITNFQAQIQIELLRVLQNTGHILVAPKPEAANKPQESSRLTNPAAMPGISDDGS
ncbi:MAG TPA: DUF6680 family protein, partial [Pirellulales bacterium]|nr:DUF6680 family protein [Pirellulales bacterium]